MKKLNHLLLLLAIPLSIGCGSKKDEPPTPPVTYTLIMENEKPEYGDVTPIGRTIHNENENVTLTVSVTQPHVAFFVGFFNKDNDELLSDKKTYTVTMNRDYHIAVRWSTRQYTVIAKSSREDTGVVTGGGLFHFQDKVTLTAIPAENCLFRGWYDEGGEQITTDNPYEFNMPSNDLTIIAKIDKLHHHMLRLISEDKTIIEVSKGGSYVAGNKINVSASILRDNAHYLFDGWYEGDNKVSENLNFEYTMPDADATLTAKWKGNLDNMSWQEIHDSDTNSIEVGSVKSILINRKKHAVRVIAKRHDYLDEGQTGCAKYTFQFDHIITKEDGNPYNIAWNTNNTNEDFINSTLNNYLDSDRTGSLFKLFPSDLQEAIMGAYKKVGVFENDKFTISGYSSAKTFPLSVTECSANRPEGAMSNEGELYPYYSGIVSLIRCTVNGSPCAYWTRSPKINTKSEAWCINSNGELGNIGVLSEFSIAPAFCVGWLRIH